MIPLQPEARRIALIGPLADDQANLLGAWAIDGRPEDVGTVLAGVRVYQSAERPDYAAGCTLTGGDAPAFAEALAHAAAADVIVLVIDEGADMSGEAHSRAHLGLPGAQQALAAGATQEVRFALPVDALRFVGPDLAWRVEPGAFAVWIGPDALRGAAGAFEVV